MIRGDTSGGAGGVDTSAASKFAAALREANLSVNAPVETLSSQSGRHESALVRTREGDAWFIKTCGESFDANALSLEGEINFYRTLAAGQFSEQLAPFVPELVRVVK